LSPGCSRKSREFKKKQTGAYERTASCRRAVLINLVNSHCALKRSKQELIKEVFLPMGCSRKSHELALCPKRSEQELIKEVFLPLGCSRKSCEFPLCRKKK